MRPVEYLLVFAAPYLAAWIAALAVQRQQVLPSRPSEAVMAQNELGRLAKRQRRALLIYSAPELVFGVAALLIAVLWQPEAGLNGTVMRWGLAGMALVRLGLSWPVWQDVWEGRVGSLQGPLRKISFRQRYALATENGPIVVLPVERAIFAAHEAGVPSTIFFTPHSKRVVAVHAPNVPVAASQPVTVAPASPAA